MRMGKYYFDKTDDGKQDVIVIEQSWLGKLLGKNMVIINPIGQLNNHKKDKYKGKYSLSSTKTSA